LLNKSNIIPSSKIKEQIKQLEFSVQTEVIGFDKEKSIMKRINQLRAEYNKIKEIEAEFDALPQLRKELKESRDIGNAVHKKVQALAEESSRIFKDLTEMSQEISEIKTRRNTIQTLLQSLKMQIDMLNRSLSTMLKKWSVSARKITSARDKKDFDIIKKKTDEVMEKLRTKKKLTTADLLVMQRNAPDN